MSRFSATTESEAVVPAPRAEIWAALTDPELLPQLTPLLKSVKTNGDTWCWNLTSISALGVTIAPYFTEQMSFVEGHRIEYTHAPPAGVHERTGANGWYQLTDVEGGTHLAISLTLEVELPLPKVASSAVRGVMSATMKRTGDRFSANLLRHLGVADPA
ncbi:MAG: Polyketide cyclase / dehydrase and lipid transport [Pseudonocardiales bacterium]|nr:Polyketide cyclase / dehydrase and lipid transport [Pseudonocardiales bacterium]